MVWCFDFFRPFILFICVTSIVLKYHQQSSYFLTFVQEMRHLDISHVRDIRTGKGVKVPKDPKLREMLSLGPGELEDKTVTVVYSTDFVNVNFVNFCTRKTDVAKVSVCNCSIFSILALNSSFVCSQFWANEIMTVLQSSHAVCLSPIQSLEKIFALIKLMANCNGKVPVKRYETWIMWRKQMRFYTYIYIYLYITLT